MAENLVLPQSKDRKQIYEAIYPQVQALIQGESDLIANLANVAAVLKEAFDFLWIGFYLVKESELVLGPFQGPLACTRIAFNRGVCGHAYQTQKPVLVPNVEAFPGHIACSSKSKSEVVVPVFDSHGVIRAVLDVDSEELNDFSEVDVMELVKIVELLKGII